MRRPSAWLLHPTFLSGVIASAFTALMYSSALGLPLFSDDLVQIPWLESLSWRELWATPSPYGYYRPLWYSLWRVWGALTGGLEPFGLHLLNLLAHAVAAWLAGMLAAAWLSTSSHSARSLSVALAAAMFTAFPFSRQAVAWPGAVYNPLVSAMVTAALLAYDRGRRTEHWGWIGGALALAALAPFVYEAGLLAGPAVVLAETVGWVHRRWSRRRSWAPCAFIALSAATLVLWRVARGAGVTGFGLTPADLRRNAGFLLQGIVFPIAPLAQWLAVTVGFSAELSLWLTALPCLGWLTWTGLRNAARASTLGIGWAVLFALPPLVAMEADWFALAPRFLYTTATGVALIWAAACGTGLEMLNRVTAPLFRGRCQRGLGAALVALVAIVLLAPAVAFVRRGMALYDAVGDVLWEATEAAVGRQPLLLVNFPSRITPHARTYPLGFEGVTPMPKRVSAAQLVYVHTGLVDAADALAFGIGATETLEGYTYELFGREAGYAELIAAVRSAHTVYLSRYEPDHIRLEEAGGIITVAHNVGSPLARFDHGVDLLAASTTCGDDGQVQLELDWYTPSGVDTDASVFAHLVDAQGSLVVQSDGYPLLGMLPFWLWDPGDAIHDVRRFSAVPPGNYTVQMGLWEPATGVRWLAEGYPEGVIRQQVRCP